MKVLSLFDGISCARLALERSGHKVNAYYASEVDKYAIQVAQKNYPDSMLIGDVKEIRYEDNRLFWHKEHSVLGNIDLLIGGSPCQDLSIAKKDRKGLAGEKSGLFWEYVRILKETMPKYFVLENVASMSKEAKQIITDTLLEIYPDTQLHMINASLVSAQNRKRLFRINIQGVTQPEDRGILLKDILDGGSNDLISARNMFNEENRRIYKGKCPTMQASWGTGGNNVPLTYIKQRGRGFNKGGEHYDKSPTLTSCSREQNNQLTDGISIRKLTPIECERLQGVPNNYTKQGLDIVKDKCNIRKRLSFNKLKGINVAWDDAKEKQHGYECVICIEEDLTNIEAQTYHKDHNMLKGNVSFVIKRLGEIEQNECVQNIIKIGEDTETHYILTKLENIIEIKYQKTDTIEVIVEETDTSYGWKITCEGVGKNERLFTMLTLIRQIIQKKIFSFAKHALSIHGYIGNLKMSHENLLENELYISKIESIVSVSNTQRYKCLGNAFNVDVVAHILSFIK